MQGKNSNTNRTLNKPKPTTLVITKTITHKTQSVTSPTASDNNKDWNIADSNKRIRSPNNITSPHPKKQTNRQISPH